jgi:hypothetical protein
LTQPPTVLGEQSRSSKTPKKVPGAETYPSPHTQKTDRKWRRYPGNGPELNSLFSFLSKEKNRGDSNTVEK